MKLVLPILAILAIVGCEKFEPPKCGNATALNEVQSKREQTCGWENICAQHNQVVSDNILCGGGVKYVFLKNLENGKWSVVEAPNNLSPFERRMCEAISTSQYQCLTLKLEQLPCERLPNGRLHCSDTEIYKHSVDSVYVGDLTLRVSDSALADELRETGKNPNGLKMQVEEIKIFQDGVADVVIFVEDIIFDWFLMDQQGNKSEGHYRK